MKILKLTFPEFDSSATLSQFLGNEQGVWGGWRVELDPDYPEADAWWVIEGPTHHRLKTNIPKGALYFATAEATWPLGFYSEQNYRAEFLNQFDHMYSCHDFYDTRMHSVPPFLPWMINANQGPHMFKSHSRDINYLASLDSVQKTRTLSVFCSMQSMLPSHRLRIRFVEQLKRYFGEEIDWFGNGLNSVAEKWDGLAPYKFSIVLENQSRHNVITEKLHDSYLSLTYPIYYGAPNVAEFFDPNSFTAINIEDLAGSIKTITNVIENLDYELALPALLTSRNKVLDEHHFIKRMIRISDQNLNSSNSSTRSTRVVSDMQSFYHLYPWKKRQIARLKNTGGRLLNRI